MNARRPICQDCSQLGIVREHEFILSRSDQGACAASQGETVLPAEEVRRSPTGKCEIAEPCHWVAQDRPVQNQARTECGRANCRRRASSQLRQIVRIGSQAMPCTLQFAGNFWATAGSIRRRCARLLAELFIGSNGPKSTTTSSFGLIRIADTSMPSTINRLCNIDD